MVTQSQFIEMFGNDSIGNCKWPTKSFGELFEISSSRRILKDDWAQEGVPFLRVRDLIYYSQTGELKNEFFVSESFYNKLKDADGRVQEGDILVSATSTIGKCMVVKNGERYYYKDADVLRFREKAPVNKVFFVYGLSMPTVENQINDTIGKTTVGHFLISKAATIKQPLPPTQLQESFERIVKQADKSKFGGLKSQFIEETQRWENEGTIRDLIHNTVEKAGKKYSADSKIRYIDISSVDNGTNTVTGVTEYIFKDAPSRAQQCVRKGDILVSTVRPNLKNIAVNHLDGADLVASSGFCVLRPKEGCAGLIMAYILSDVFTEKMTLVAKGTNYPAIHDSDILNYKIRLSDDSKVSMIDRLFKQSDKSKYMS